MANRFVSPKKLLQTSLRPPNSAAPSSITAVSPLNLDEKPTTILSNSIINLDDTKSLFSSLSTTKLLRSAINLHAAAVEPVVDLGTWVVNSKLMDTGLPRGVIRHTFFEQFCAGENSAEACRKVSEIWDSGLRGMLNYALEHAGDNESCDRNLDGFLRTVEAAKSLPPSSVSCVVVKVTAICPIGLLKRVSDLLRWEYKNESFQLPWKLDTLPIFSDSSPFYHTPRKPDPLTPEEEQNLCLVLKIGVFSRFSTRGRILVKEDLQKIGSKSPPAAMFDKRKLWDKVALMRNSLNGTSFLWRGYEHGFSPPYIYPSSLLL